MQPTEFVYNRDEVCLLAPRFETGEEIVIRAMISGGPTGSSDSC
jgi:hypothetical protein